MFFGCRGGGGGRRDHGFRQVFLTSFPEKITEYEISKNHVKGVILYIQEFDLIEDARADEIPIDGILHSPTVDAEFELRGIISTKFT